DALRARVQCDMPCHIIKSTARVKLIPEEHFKVAAFDEFGILRLRRTAMEWNRERFTSEKEAICRSRSALNDFGIQQNLEKFRTKSDRHVRLVRGLGK